jgi:hypothetical protein
MEGKVKAIKHIFVAVLIFWALGENGWSRESGIGNNDSKIVARQITNPETGKSLSGSIFGKISDLETKKGIENVEIKLFNDGMKLTKTNKKGEYCFSNLHPGKYKIEFCPSGLYCCQDKFCEEMIKLEQDTNIKLDKIFEIGGSLKGIIYKTKGIPFENTRINIYFNNCLFSSVSSNQNGEFYIEGICPANSYLLTIDPKIPGHASKFIKDIKIEKGKYNDIGEFIYDFDDLSGIEGYVKSSIDGKILPNARLSFHYLEFSRFNSGEVYTDDNGYFCIKNLEPGNYDVLPWWPTNPPKKNPKTGLPYFTAGLIEKLIRGNRTVDSVTTFNSKTGEFGTKKTISGQTIIKVEIGKISRIIMELPIPSDIETKGFEEKKEKK